MKAKLWAVCGLGAILTGFGCSDSGSHGIGVAGDTLIKDASDEDFVKICQWNQAQVDSLLRSVSARESCTFAQAPYSTDSDMCEDAVSECVDAAEDGEKDEPESCEDREPLNIAAGCYGITVSDYEACVKALRAHTKKVIKEASCEAAGERPERADDLAPNCSLILDHCPSIVPELLRPDESLPVPVDEEATTSES